MLASHSRLWENGKFSTFEIAEAATSDDYGIFANSISEIVQLEHLCLRDCVVITSQPGSFAKDLFDKATKIQEVDTAQAIESSEMVSGSER